ncbi:MAG: M67 family metallopeptidase [Nitrososphaerales archaeon]
MHETEIALDQQLLTEIHSHASSTYPEECCGLMIGRLEGVTKRVNSLKRMKNMYAPAERYHRYAIDPMEYLKAENEIESTGEEIVGIYHSHPNAPAKPSFFDQSYGWPTLSYVVVEVREGKPVSTASWVLKDDRSEFLQEEMRVVAVTPGNDSMKQISK